MSARHALLIGINRYPNIAGADLHGCVNDLELMAALLVDRFGFARGDLMTLRDGEATRDGVRAAFDAFTGRIGPGDLAVVFYAGHGSRMRDPADEAQLIESMVTHDSGRGDAPNRDILDRELDGWIQQINRKTPHLTLLFDCCHSGSVTRDVALGQTADATRQVIADQRDRAAMFQGIVAPRLSPSTRGLSEPKGASGWVPSGRREALFIAACRAEELAHEHRADAGEVVRHGALTFFLGQELARARPGATWRDLFERVAPQINAHHPRQHAVMEGSRDRELFGRVERPPSIYFQVAAAPQGDRVRLAGGAAHGVTVGSRLALYPHGAHAAGPEDQVIARLEVAAVAATSCEARIVEATGSIEPGQRAFDAGAVSPGARLRVRLASADAELAAAIDRLPGLARVEGDADVVLRLLAPRTALAEGAPCPHLGALDRPTWAGVGSDGRLAIHLHPAGPGAATRVALELAAVARYRGLLTLDNPRSTLAGELSLEILRRVADGSQFVPASREDDGGLVVFEEGDVADFVLRNTGAREVYVTLLEFGTDGAIAPLLPSEAVPPNTTESARLGPGEALRLSAYYDMPEGLPLHLPEGFPWAAEPGEETSSGLLTLKLLATRVPTDLSGLSQEATRFVQLGAVHPLEAQVQALAHGAATRSFRPRPKPDGTPRSEDDWAAITRGVVVRRPRPGVALDPDGEPVIAAPGITISSPGLAGNLVVETGDPARTRDLAGPGGPQEHLFAAAMGDAEMCTVATIELRDARSAPTRSLAAPTTAIGEPALEVSLDAAGEGWAQAALVSDADGVLRWCLPAVGDDGRARLTIPRAAPAQGQGTRSLLGTLARQVIKVLTWRAKKLAVDAAASAVVRWEERRRPHRLRSFTEDDFARAPVEDGAQAPGPAPITAADWDRLAKGRALLVIHGNMSRTDQAFGALGRDVVAALRAAHGGRALAFDHPTLSREPDENAKWLIDQVPKDISLELDVLAHSRGGLVARALAEWGPRWSGGRVRVRRLVAVGTPHRGTPLADLNHCDLLLSVLTNLIGLSPIPVASDVIAGVLELAKDLTVGAAGKLPGLVALSPDSAFLTRINAAESVADEPIEYYGISSAFGVAEGSPRLARLRAFALTTLTRAVFREEHDLVVPTRGVLEVAGCPRFPIPEERRLILGIRSLRELPGVGHDEYFGNPEVQARLVRWLS